MCGILGIVPLRQNSNLAGSSLTEADVVRMRDQMSNRGPDDATCVFEKDIIFAHRRLVIRDKEFGKQPVYSPNRNFLIVYNGEIYNDSELRQALRKKGYRFSGQGDTEVLAAAWEAWEHRCISKLRGMFAFAVYDFRNRKLTLVRDRLGIKPAFYSAIGNDFVFASAISAIKSHPRFDAKPNLNVIRHYLSTFRITLDSATVFSDVQTVRPGEFMTLENGKLTEHTFWTPPTSDENPELSFEESIDQLEQMLRDAVQVRMVSDVPVGMMLSGGVDSNTLATILGDQRPGGFHACCGTGVAASYASEDLEFAKSFAETKNIDLDCEPVDAETYRETWQELLTTYQTPLSTPSDVIIHRIAKNLKRTIGVALGGEGADEACCGYEIPHWSGADFDLWKNTEQMPIENSELALDSLERQYGAHQVESPGDFYLACNGLIPRQIQSKLFRPSYWEAADCNRHVESYYGQLFAGLPPMSNAEKSAHVLLRTNLESLLSRLDSATMSVGLESRVPFADHRLIEQVFRLPHSYRIDISPHEQKPWLSSMDLSNRGSLRPKRLVHGLAHRLMPQKFAARKKSSFATPVPQWIGSEWKEWADQKIKSSEFLNEIFEPDALESFSRLPGSLAMWNWPMLNLAMWGDQTFL